MKEQNHIRNSVKNSFILKFIRAIINTLVSSFKSSFVGRMLVSGGKGEDMYTRGAFRNFFGIRSRRNGGIKKFRRFVSSSVEKSFIFSGVKALPKYLFGLKLRSIGSFFLSYSFFAALIVVIRYYPFDTNEWFVHVFTLIVMIAISLPFVFSKQNLVQIMSESRMFSTVFSESLGVDFEQKKRESKNVKIKSKYFGIAPTAGIICGLLSFVIAPLNFALLLIILTTALFVFSKPEVGVIITLFLIPFGELFCANGFDVLTVMIIFTFVAYLVKIVFGKREILIDFQDIFMLFLLLIVVSCCFGNPGAGNYNDVIRVSFFIILYFLFVNLIKTRGWFLRAVNALVFSMCVTVVLGVMIPLLAEIPYVRDVVPSLDSLSDIYIFGHPSETVYVLIPVLPFLFAAVSSSKPGRGTTYMAYLVLAVVCIIFGGNPVANFGIAAAVLMYVLCVKPTWVFALFPMGLAYIATVGLKIPFISGHLEKLELFAENTLNENFYVSLGSAEALKDYIFTGIGFGSDSFSKIYPNYAHAGFENAQYAGNAILQLLLGFGIIGFFIAFLAVVVFMRETFSCIVRTDDVKDKTFLSAAVSTVIGYIVAATCDNVFAIDTVYIYIFVSMAISSSYMRITKNEIRRKYIKHSDTCDHVDIFLPARTYAKTK